MATTSTTANLDARYPALRQLGKRPSGRSVPFVQQLTSADCGAACLAMVLAMYGRRVPLEELRVAVGADQNGTDALSMLRGARTYALRGRGVRADVDDLDCLPMGAILHWQFNHFVVFERATRRHVVIVDPALGRRRISREAFGQGFTGVALIMEPGDGFVRQRDGKGTLARRFLRQILSHPSIWTRVLLLSMLVQTFALALPLMTSVLVDRIVPRHDYDLLLVLGAGLAVMVTFSFLTTLIRSNLLVQLRTLLDAEMTLGFVDHLLALPFAFFQQRSAGDLMLRMGSNATVREILTSGALSAVLDGALVVTYLVIIFVQSPVLGGVVVGLAAVQLSIYLATRKRQRELMTESLAAQARTSGFEVEMLAGVETLKAMGAEYRAVERWSNLFVDHLNVSLHRARLDALVGSILGAFGMAAPLVILGTGAALVLSGSLSLGAMLGLSAVAAGFLGPMSTLVNTTLKFQLLGSYLERIEDVMQTKAEQADTTTQPAHRLGGAIGARGVSFSYGQGTAPAVCDVSVDIAPGQFVAIVGPSGAGKSTLAKLLVGMYEPAQGHIAYDGVELRALELRSVRQQIGVVNQQAALFGMSVRENIALGTPGATLEQVVRAAQLARVHDDIAALPMGYDTVLADGGGSLSGGQRQRLALARALVGSPAVLLLDEATSALDSVTEAAVQRSLSDLRCTRIVVAHRLSTVARADLILVMDRGRVIEWGTHDGLLGHGTVYRRLYETQVAR
jgi:ABC-type bacteriocin/lantibiotic exporter with double-glycine peptidase domain